MCVEMKGKTRLMSHQRLFADPSTGNELLPAKNGQARMFGVAVGLPSWTGISEEQTVARLAGEFQSRFE